MPFEDGVIVDDLGEFVPPPKFTIVAKQCGKTTTKVDTNWKRFLASLTVGDVLNLKRVRGQTQLVVADSTQTVGEVLRLLVENSILSVPVVERGDHSVRFIGFVDILDIEGLAVKIIEETKSTLHEFFSNPFFEKPIRQAMNSTISYEWKPVEETTNLLEILCAFQGKDLLRPHRLPVSNGDGRVIGVISQSDLVKMASENMHLLGNKINNTVEELGVVHPVIAVRSTAKAIDVLSILFENRIHGVAVVDHSTNKLIANLSASDLRGMRREDLGLFDKTVMEFLQSMNAKRGGMKSPVWCPPRSMLSQVITLLATQNVHRVFIADERQQVIGVVSLSDVITALQHF